MSLIDAYMTPCVFMIATKAPDGSGGQVTTWAEGDRFRAAIIRDVSGETRTAESAKAASIYTVTVHRDVKMKFHDIFKRISDGKTFRITSGENEDKTPPVISSLNMAISTAEEWELTE